MKKKWLLLMAACAVFLCLRLPAAGVEYGGSCGDNATWQYDETTATLTITGSGELSYGDCEPWFDLRNSVTTLVVGEGITALGHGSFRNFRMLTEVSLPKTLTAISEYAFDSCSSLKTMPYGEGITSIGAHAFRSCTGFAEVTIPGHIQHVGRGAFNGCRNITGLTIEEGVRQIDADAFGACRSLRSVSLPDTVEALGGSAFSSCGSLQSVRLSNRITLLNNGTFSHCYSLEQITLPSSLTEIRDSAFAYCTSLTEITIPAAVHTIAVTAFIGSDELQLFRADSANSTFRAVDGVLYKRADRELFLMPPGYTGNHTVEEGTKKIGDYACHDVTKLTRLHIPDSVTQIGEYSLCHCSGLKEISGMGGLVSVGYRGFAWCTSLEKLSFPRTLKVIGQDALCDCKGLQEVYFSGDLPEFCGYNPQYGQGPFEGTKLTAYYPGKNPTWKGGLKDYGGALTWRAITCSGSHTPVTVPGTAATCTTQGLTDGSLCGRCGELLKTQEKTAPSHSYGEWAVKTPATLENTGLSERKCRNCQSVETKTLPRLTQTGTNSQSTTGKIETQKPITQTQQPATHDGTDNETAISPGEWEDTTVTEQEPEQAGPWEESTVPEEIVGTGEELSAPTETTEQTDVPQQDNTGGDAVVMGITVAACGVAATGGGAAAFFRFKKRRY